MNFVQKKLSFVALLIIGLMIGSHITMADTTTVEYKQGFSAVINAAQEVPPTTSAMTGDATFNVRMDERFIDYTVNTTNGVGITDIVLGCARPGVNGTTVVSLFHNATGVSAMSTIASGTITEDQLMLPDAFVCSPNIHTMPHLVQAMREGSVYVNVLTTANPAGEIRGQLGDGILPSPVTTGTPDTTATTTATSTATSTPAGTGGTGGSPATTTDATSTPAITSGGTSGGIAPSTIGAGASTGGVASSTSSTTNGGQVLGASTERTCSAYLTGYIKPGVKNDPYNVALLQIFLNKNMNAGLTLNGHYDAASIAAVNAFQLAHADVVLKPWTSYGLPTATTTTGYVYKTTKWTIDNIACGTNTAMPQLP